MIRDVLSQLHWSTLPIVSMLLFASVFVGAVIWVYRKNSKAIYEEASLLPLDRPTVKGGHHE
ncbi:MAG: cbb3-type cytochrome c oxidase subunit 3 [Bdellovibrionales bacterium]|nr:cbb3-type cytochrome c oxidase subunit 3 [Bdellovibrionales bacterium]